MSGSSRARLMRAVVFAFVFCGLAVGCREHTQRSVEERRGRIVVRGPAKSHAEVALVADTAEPVAAWLATRFGYPEPPFDLSILWLPRKEWERDIPERIPYGMPFATLDRLIVLPACDLEVPVFLHDITDAAGAPRASAKECSGHYRAILAHELFHTYWAYSGYPREPVWLREGMAQTAVLAARDWPRLGDPARAWIALNEQLYERGLPDLPTRDVAALARSYREITPLHYSWLLARLFRLFNELEVDLSAIPRTETITDEEAAQVLDPDRDWTAWGIP